MAAPPAPPARLLPAGFEILCTAVHPSEREQLQALAQEHGFQLFTSVGKVPPHLVITRSVKSPKYRAVMRSNPAVPVVLPDWLLASAQQGRRLPYDGYRVGPFLGLTICFSGISVSRKQALSKQVQQVGGMHSAALDKKCTHLVTESTQTEKYK
jgi:topoisomerase (DNA) II binding protein 1